MNRSQTLWFAFILLSLSYWKQRGQCPPDVGQRCDLLSFYYLCRTGNNENWLSNISMSVVICFHFTIFVVLEPTKAEQSIGNTLLWFAFILLYLSYCKQQSKSNAQEYLRCDLLSFYYLCRTGNNSLTIDIMFAIVVICFHFTIFVVLETTNSRLLALLGLLWFAFILLSLSYWKQLENPMTHVSICCDLLSFYYLCRTGNNRGWARGGGGSVVICFHFTIFVVLETTLLQTLLCTVRLWFAFILLSLSYWKQLDLYYSLYVSAL